MNRQEIRDKIIECENNILQLQKDIEELNRKDMLLSDDKQWFTEAWEEHSTGKGRRKVTKSFFVGRINWVERFNDENDPAEFVDIDRSMVVRVDGVWQRYIHF